MPKMVYMQMNDVIAIGSETLQAYANYAKFTWNAVANLKEGQQTEKTSFMLFEDQNAFSHRLTSYELRHIYKNHGDRKSEKQAGNIAICVEDLLKIPNILLNPVYMIEKIKVSGVYHTLYAQYDNQGTYIYIEQISRKNKTSTIKTFYKNAKKVDIQKIMKIMGSKKKYDLSEVKNISREGGNPLKITD
jgi:hypothetical protein